MNELTILIEGVPLRVTSAVVESLIDYLRIQRARASPDDVQPLNDTIDELCRSLRAFRARSVA